MTETRPVESNPAGARLALDELLCFAIHSAAQAVGRANKPMLDKVGLTYPQFLVMIVLWAEDNRTVGAIGEKLFLESSTLTPLLKRLEAAGFVRRDRCTQDERQVRVRLTSQGQALQETLRDHRPEWLERVFGTDVAEARALKHRMMALRDRLLRESG